VRGAVAAHLCHHVCYAYKKITRRNVQKYTRHLLLQGVNLSTHLSQLSVESAYNESEMLILLEERINPPVGPSEPITLVYVDV